MCPKVYFFDFWKTLVYSDFKGINLKEYLSFNDEEFLNYQNFLFKNSLDSKTLYDSIEKEFNLNETQISKIQELNNNILINSQVYSDTLESLEKLSLKSRLYLISDGFSVTENIFNSLIPENIFSQTFFSYKYGKIKSEGLIQIVLNNLDLKPEDVHFIGDSIKRDYSPCQDLGIKCTLIDRNKNKPKKGIITNLNEI